MFKLISFTVTLFILAIGMVLGVLNPAPVTLDLFLIRPTLPLSLVLAAMLILGVLLGASVMLVQVAQLKWRLRKQVKVNQKQSSQLIQLKKEQVNVNRALKESDNALLKLEK
ncbi:LapA family protein [Thiomicrorhabdus arctica]|uniref:LapA family protein n=1 Tax=Thiomicrorhabdus arctica TaxID=131540 RepID=UPI00036A8D4A|nr:LapA family protein [Thiomicrorhabdus arctica]